MGKSFKRLQRVLELEAAQKYKNKAVVGGIRQFATFWVSQAREEAVDEADAAFVEQTAELLNGYGALSGGSARERTITRLLERLEWRDNRIGEQTPPVAKSKAPQRKPTANPKSAPPAKKEVKGPVPERQKTAVTPQKSKKPQPVAKTHPDSADRTKLEPVSHQAESRQKITPDPEGLTQATMVIRGVGPRMAETLSKLGADTVHDLLRMYPRRYDDYTLMKPINKLQYGEQVTVIGTVWEVRARKSRNNTIMVQAVISDGSGKVSVNWYGQQWLLQKLKAGHRIVLSGTVEQYLGRPVFNSPHWEMLSMDALRHGRIVPLYSLTQGISNHKIRQIMKGAVPYWSARVPDILPDETLTRHKLYPLSEALLQIHLPEGPDELIQARRRLVFNELLLLQLGMLGHRQDWIENPGRPLNPSGDLLQSFTSNLAFEMTNAQKRVVAEIKADISRPVPMNRMLQGDVGAGKTVVAAAAMITAVAAGTQAALMAPTEILAEQHYNGFKRMLEPLNMRVVVLTGRLNTADKQQAKEMIADGTADIVIGTHALIQPDVTFANLGLAVIDEQHRFGVDQRKALRDKGPQGDGALGLLTPHILVMSATPIPRSLALSMYGDLDLSVLDEMPPGRQEISTHWIRPRERERCYAFVRGQVQQGRQAYIICPLVEESDKIEAVAAVEEHQRLSADVFPDLRLGLVHGKLSGAEKESVMRQFYENELDVLVSTSVIEVGVDVPNSTVMVIEGANRFGLAQLHQFRGRVGRGQHKSYCLLVADETTTDAEERLTALEQTNDGFQLAEKDLQLRGPGQFFGRQQSGLPELQLASLTDMTMLELARGEAQRIIATDPHLERPEHHALRERVAYFWDNAADVS